MRRFRFEPGAVARHAPDLAGHCQRRPDGFYRGNCDGGGSSSESTDVDNTTNGDTENQNSDETEGDESGDDVQSEEQSEDEQQDEGATTSDGETVVTAAENEQAKTASYEMIDSANKLKEKLGNASGTANFMLTEDIDLTNDNDNHKTIQLDNDGSNITLDLNGHKIKYASNGQPLFNITGGATLTVKDGTQTAPTETTVNQKKMNGNLALMECDDSNIPNKLTYYVTESVAKGTGATEITGTTEVPGTTETLKEYKVDIKGAIVACGDHANLKLVNLYKTGGKAGTFNLESGAITQQQNSRDQNNSVSSLVYAEEDSTVSMSGGYVCGATSMDHGAGIELGINNGQGATLNLTGGVIAGNYAPDGGGVYANGSTINMTVGTTVGTTGGTTGGTISGNGTFEDRPGYGAGICAFGSSAVNISGGYITNNNCQFNYITQNKLGEHKGFGCHGGGGIAAYNGGSLQISGGYITSNYSAEAGGGVYAGFFHLPLDSFTFSGGTIASNVAQNSEGGGVRIAAPTVGTFDVKSGQKAYITNNETKTTNDWGGGGIFVQGGGNWNEGNSSTPVASARLYIYNTLIENNHAEGYGGGFAACPTGKTAITDTNGIAIFGNRDENGTHLSGGTNGKNEDQPTTVKGGEITDTFKQNGHKDLFLIRKSDNSDYIAAVTGQMLGGGAANWKGTIDGQPPTTIGKYEGAQAKYMIGLDADPSDGDQGLARDNATLFITGNESNVHGGGIMTNGDVVAGSTTKVSVYPKMKLSGTKALTGRTLNAGEFKFQLLKQGANAQAPSFANRKLQLNGCLKVGDGVTNDSDGSFTFDLGRVYSDDSIVYYLVEDPGDKPVAGVDYDETIYKIEFETNATETRKVLDIFYTYYSVASVKVTNLKNNQSETIAPSNSSDVSIKITKGKTFTNAYAATGTWTPRVTKKVDGGEMKKFKFKLFTENTGNTEKTFQPIYKCTSGSKNPQTVEFDPVEIGPLGDDELDSNRQAQFTYYICECLADENEGTKHEGYKNDTKRFKVVVTATDNGDGTLNCTPTYYEVDANGAEFKTDDPTFTNTYSTTLPLSGMSGVTLTYLAGAAVLCAAAAWMHIRRKANAKGGERRE